MHVDPICPYIKFIRKYHLGDTTIKSDVSLAWMKIIAMTGRFEIAEVPTFDLD